MYVCVCVCVRVHACAEDMARGAVAVKNSMFFHKWHYRNQRKWEKRKSAGGFGSACYKTDVHLLTNNII